MITTVPDAPSAEGKKRQAERHKRRLSSTPENSWLRFDRNVSRELVHRKALTEVLITDTIQVADDEFLLGTQLPRAHLLWSDRRYPFYDPLLAIEVCRQACLVIPHRYYGVETDSQFISKQISMHVVNLDALSDDDGPPPEGVIRARFSDSRVRHGRLREISAETELTIDGVTATMASGDLMFFSRLTYQRLRSQQ